MTLSEFFGDSSPLNKHLPGFQPRAAQGWMAEAVEEAIEASARLIVEAGTGTGKTFAYLVPALLSGKKTIVSTGTKALQDQLYHRDLPLVSKAVGRPVTTALLKGRANYLCLHRLDQVDTVPASLRDDISAVTEWRHRTRSGDRAELVDVAEDSAIWPIVTSTTDNCLGQKCPLYKDCFVVKARRAAQEADLVVVNHHLLLADLAMKESGFVEFLPGAETIVVDEAHQLPDLATQFFGVSLGSRELERLVEESRAATLGHVGSGFQARIDAVDTAVRKLRAAAPRDEGRHQLADVIFELRPLLEQLGVALRDLCSGLETLAEASPELEKAAELALVYLERLSHVIADDSWDGLRWLQVNARSLRLHVTPLDVSDTLSSLLGNGYQAWVLTSATLAVGEDFSHFASRMGLNDARALSFQSPFPIADNSLIYLPPDMPQPSSRDHTDKVMETLADMLALGVGGAFCLFTSHRALQAARRWARDNRRRFGRRELLIQGDAPRDDLLRRFRAAGNAVLLGTGSFWEGVDVRGRALSMVVIDKLPFTSPADPLLMARLEYLKRQGGNGFMDHQVPQAVLSLKQGAGRLLRDEADYGVVVLCDPRITQKRYGQVFLDALRPMPVTDNLNDVASFLAQRDRAGAVA